MGWWLDEAVKSGRVFKRVGDQVFAGGNDPAEGEG